MTGLAEFEAMLELTRARGWATDVEETWEGVAAVAAPIHDRRRMPVGAIAITGAVERLCEAGELASGADRGGARMRPFGVQGHRRRAVLNRMADDLDSTRFRIGPLTRSTQDDTADQRSALSNTCR